ncbi:MAG: helix-turn-helix domain-containing protein [Pseudomonadota bacterium]
MRRIARASRRSRYFVELVAAERQIICRAVGEAGNSRQGAAKLLGISRTALHNLINGLQIKLPPRPQGRRGRWE